MTLQPSILIDARHGSDVTQVQIVCSVIGELVLTGTCAVTLEGLAPGPWVVDPCPACPGAHQWTRDEAIRSPH